MLILSTGTYKLRNGQLANITELEEDYAYGTLPGINEAGPWHREDGGHLTSAALDIIERGPSDGGEAPKSAPNTKSRADDKVRQNGRKTPSNEKSHKLPFSLMPPEWEAALVFLLGKGALKYAPHDWEENPGSYAARYESLRRHLLSWYTGDKFDQETGAHNLVAVAFNALMLYSWDQRDVGDDDIRTYGDEVERLTRQYRRGVEAFNLQESKQ